MKRVLIFGVSGFVGGYLTKEFINNGYTVFGADRFENSSLEIDFSQIDILNSVEIVSLVKRINPDVIVNLAAISSVGASWHNPQDTMSINVVGTLNILEAVRNVNSHIKVMLIGSSEEYAESDTPINETYTLNANNPYGLSKMTQERFAEMYRDRYNMNIYCVRAFNHTGVGQNEGFVIPSFCKQAAEIEKSGKAGVIKVGNLSAKRDFSDVRDVVRAYRMIIESDNSDFVYNVGSGKAYGLDELLEYIISLSSQNISIEVSDDRFRPVDNPVICCDNNKIIGEIGWIPEYTVFDSIKEMFDFYKNQEEF